MFNPCQAHGLANCELVRQRMVRLYARTRNYNITHIDISEAEKDKSIAYIETASAKDLQRYFPPGFGPATETQGILTMQRMTPRLAASQTYILA